MTGWTTEKRLIFIRSTMKGIYERSHDGKYATDVAKMADIISDIEVDLEFCLKHLNAIYDQEKVS